MAAPQPMGEKPQLMGRQVCAASSKQAESRAPGSNSSATWACVGSHSVRGPWDFCHPVDRPLIPSQPTKRPEEAPHANYRSQLLRT